MEYPATASADDLPASIGFWDEHYRAGHMSGPGSSGVLAEYKASFLNAFVDDRNIVSVVDFGCGDGAQLALTSYPDYVGLDVSRHAVRRCLELHGDDPAKSFFLYDPRCFADRTGRLRADLAISLDVIYHLLEDEVFELYMRHLFTAATRYVVVYSSDEEDLLPGPGVRHRRFTPWVRANAP